LFHRRRRGGGNLSPGREKDAPVDNRAKKERETDKEGGKKEYTVNAEFGAAGRTIEVNRR